MIRLEMTCPYCDSEIRAYTSGVSATCDEIKKCPNPECQRDFVFSCDVVAANIKTYRLVEKE